MTNEERLISMEKSLERMQKRFEKAFDGSLKQVKEFLEGKKGKLESLGINDYEIPTSNMQKSYVYEVANGRIRPNNSSKSIEDLPLSARNKFVNDILSDWEGMKQKIDTDIENKLNSSIEITQGRIDEMEKSLQIMGVDLDSPMEEDEEALGEVII